MDVSTDVPLQIGFGPQAHFMARFVKFGFTIGHLEVKKFSD